eukprot:15433831-Alexandrium_andersonii.AAC.1
MNSDLDTCADGFLRIAAARQRVCARPEECSDEGACAPFGPRSPSPKLPLLPKAAESCIIIHYAASAMPKT